jgi:hypothetical protein
MRAHRQIYFLAMRRGSLLLYLLVAIAFVATIAAIHPWKIDSVTTTEPNSIGAAQYKIPDRLRIAERTEGAMQASREQTNRARQKPGPPDPEAQRTAAASAENAARAAADLAGSVPSPGN